MKRSKVQAVHKLRSKMSPASKIRAEKRTQQLISGISLRGMRSKNKPLIVDVSFSKGMLRVALADGREVSVPLNWFPRLQKATMKQRKDWRLIGGGIGIHWEGVDEDVSVERLLVNRKPPTKTHRQMVEEWKKDPEFKAAYEELDSDFAFFKKFAKAVGCKLEVHFVPSNTR